MLTIKEFVKTVIEAENNIELKIKRMENMKITYKKLIQKIEKNIVYFSEKEFQKRNSISSAENFFIINLLHGENFEELPENHLNTNIGYISLRYCDIFQENLPKSTKDPQWNEKFRL